VLNRNDFGEDGEGDLFGSIRAYIETNRPADPRDLRLLDAPIGQCLATEPLGPFPTDLADEAASGAQGGLEGGQIELTVMSQDDDARESVQTYLLEAFIRPRLEDSSRVGESVRR
jgi:hypothetical protein